MHAKTIGLEEHYVTHDVLRAWSALEPQWQTPAGMLMGDDIARRLADLGEERLAAMQDTGLDVQVLSLTAPGLQDVPSHEAVVLQKNSNDLVADAVRLNPTHLQGFAALAITNPSDAARELERSVTTLGLNGAMIFPRSRGRFLENHDYWPIFEAAAALNAPLYLHTQTPPARVQDVYYRGFDDPVNAALATYGVGWHYDVGLALLRLVPAGVFDKFPNLQVIVGHWGELVLFYLDRVDRLAQIAELPRSITDYCRTNVLVTPSGMFSQRYLRWALEVVGADRILFSTDYPWVFAPDGGARPFLHEAQLSSL